MRSRRTTLGKGIGVGIRRVVLVGNSAGIILPREFLVSHKIGIGDEVAVAWDGNLQVIPPHRSSPREEEGSGKKSL